jgi:N-glycosylase/DNA lyase
VFPLRDYDLSATLGCGQAFRWTPRANAWEGVVAGRWVRVRTEGSSLVAEVAVANTNWDWLTEHLRLDEDLPAILATFPDDPPMRAATTACQGLRLLRQEPWECLASFILSSSKQIVQIRQCVRSLCERFGEPVAAPANAGPQFAFPSAARLAAASEAELRACKLGFRAKYLRDAARRVAAGELELDALRALPTPAAREQLMACFGVGRKIADCVLLFAYGRQDAFPVDVWVRRALQQLYFPKRRPSKARLLRFAGTHFGPNAGHAQQYLFHYMRLAAGRADATWLTARS